MPITFRCSRTTVFVFLFHHTATCRPPLTPKCTLLRTTNIEPNTTRQLAPKRSLLPTPTMDPKATRPDYAYLDHPDFPVNAAEPGAPRMLKLLNPANPVEGESSGLQPRLGDFVVTILHHIAVSPTKYSSCFPTALDSFFDRTVAEYKLRGQYKPEDKKDPTNFIIWRKGDWVLVSLSTKSFLKSLTILVVRTLQRQGKS